MDERALHGTSMASFDDQPPFQVFQGVEGELGSIKEAREIGLRGILQGTTGWKYGTFECCKNPDICLLGCICPCFLVHRVASRVSDGPWMFTAMSCFFPMIVALRYKLRHRYGIVEDVFTDAMMAGCCVCPFNLCQLGNEVRGRGEWDQRLPKYDTENFMREAATGVAAAAARRLAAEAAANAATNAFKGRQKK
jgi:Cys-rich protein (TIGR01571 family)